MPVRLLALLFLLLLSSKIYAIEFPVEIIEYLDDVKVVAFINESDIDKSLRWNPAQGKVPLGIDDALKAIREHVAADPELKQASLTGIELKQIPHHSGYWHYMVKMKTRVNNRNQAHYFIVLMNGKVIPGIREPESVK